MDPARMFKESLTSRPELENSQGQSRRFGAVSVMSGLPLMTDRHIGDGPISSRRPQGDASALAKCHQGVAARRQFLELPATRLHSFF
jgi:hypothetical protein